MWKIRSQKSSHTQSGFTLIEIIVVLGIMALLASILGVSLANMAETAREAQTKATITKIDGLLVERLRGLERTFRGNDFERYVRGIERSLETSNSAFRTMSPRAIEIIARKQFIRQMFPQRFAEMTDGNNDGIPDRLANDEVYGLQVVPPAVNWTAPTSPTTQRHPVNSTTSVEHDPNTESSELLYFMLTRMEVLGFPSVAEDEFLTQEVADTDSDGLPEFVDGWGRPLRFYRWPTRLVRPFGLLGADQAPGASGVDDDGIGATDDTLEVGFKGTDDVVINSDVRFLATTYISALPGPPGVTGQYDMLNEDPDDAYGILLAEAKRIYALTGGAGNILFSFNETTYHSVDTYHAPLVVSAGSDGILGLFEPNQVYEDVNGNGSLDPGEDVNRNGALDAETADIDSSGTFEAIQGHLAMPRGLVNLPEFGAADDISNMNSRAGS